MNSFIYDVLGIATKVLPIALTILLASMSALTMVGSSFQKRILARDADGKRLFMLGLGVLTLSLFSETGTRTIAFATFGVTLMAFGSLIWLDDEITKKFLTRRLGIVYLVLALASYGFGAFWGATSFSFNAIGFRELAVPVGGAVLFGSLAAFALLSEQFKDRILPQNRDGGRLVTFGVVTLVLTLFSVNPIMLVAMATFSATWIVFGGLIWVSDWLTKVLLKTWLWPIYAIISVAIFNGSVDFFTTTFLMGLAMMGVSVPMGIYEMMQFAKADPAQRKLFAYIVPAIVYFALGFCLVSAAGLSLLID